jgi:hypothetical protein
MSTYLRLDSHLMREAAKKLDAAAETARRLGTTVPSLADGYDLPPEIASEVRRELTMINHDMRLAAERTGGLGRNLRARADRVDLADEAGEPSGLPGRLKERLLQVAETFECPLDDPAKNLLYEATASAAGGASVGAVRRLADALNEIVDGAEADALRNFANDNLETCLPPLELPELPPPPRQKPTPAGRGVLRRHTAWGNPRANTTASECSSRCAADRTATSAPAASRPRAKHTDEWHSARGRTRGRA